MWRWLGSTAVCCAASLGAVSATPPQPTVDVIVHVEAGSQAQDLERFPGLLVRREFELVPALAVSVPRASLPALRRAQGVVRVEPDARVRAANDTAQRSFGVAAARLELPSLDGNADGAPSFSAGDLVAAVLDTGIDAAHPDLDGGKVIAFADCVGKPCVHAAPTDPDGHGTHVAGILAGAGDADPARRGVAPGAALVGVRVLPPNADGVLSDVVAGIEWAVANRAAYGIEVLNLSLGSLDGTVCSNGTDAASMAVNAAVARGLVVVVAAGNEGPEPCTVSSPAAAQAAITVASMADAGLQPTKLGFFQGFTSSRGPTADGRLKPDLSAPGWSITSAQAGTGGYTAMTGTSMATPFVAGVALLLLEQKPQLTAAEVKSVLLQTAEDWGRGGDNRTPGSRGHDIDYGAGRLDAYAALAAVGAPLARPPQVPVHELHEGSFATAGGTVSYPLEITTTALPIAATLIHPDFEASQPVRFDLRLRDPSGAQVATSEDTVRRQKRVRFAPASIGTYTLDVVAVTGSGDFFVDVAAPTGTPPVNGQPPAVVGTAQAGQRLLVAPGVWAGRPRPYVSRSWLRCVAGTDLCTPFAAGAEHVDLGAADAGWSIRVRETARNGYGEQTVESVATAPVAAPPNRPPVARAGPDRTVALSGARMVAIPLDGSGSADPDGDSISLTWSAGGSTVATGQSPTVTLGLGIHVLTLVADDGRATHHDELVVTVVDATPPVIEPQISGRLGRGGWYTADVSIRWVVADPESNATRTDCADVVVASDFRGRRVSCSARSAGGATTREVVIARDAAPPTIRFSGNRKTYAVDETVAIACVAADVTSGLVAPGKCPSVNAPAYELIGTRALSAAVVDAAGNAASRRQTFRVRVTAGGVCGLVERFVAQRGIEQALCRHLDRGNVVAFRNLVAAVRGKRLSPDAARILTRLARQL